MQIANEHHDFNSHARVGRDSDIRTALQDTINFNSHARVGRDLADWQTADQFNISTHTPV